MDQSKLYQTQISMTEWFERVNHQKTAELRAEDNSKCDRLKILNDIIGLPFDRPYNFKATDIDTPTAAFDTFAREHPNDLWVLRLIPTDPAMPKLRMRGKKIPALMDWFHEQSIDPTKYKVEFGPHSDKPLWATIFVVNAHGVFGEVIRGGHFQLTQGFYDEYRPVTFSYDWKRWKLSDESPAYQEHVEELLSCVEVKDRNVQQQLARDVGASFAHNHLRGYFETMTNEDTGIWFVDYNRILGDMYSEEVPKTNTYASDAVVSGQPASKGMATGTVRIIREAELADARINDGDILVCDITTPDYAPLMQKAAAVVTDRGGILSHAAIVCRELGKPCIAGTGNATEVLKNGQKITVNATDGVVLSA